MNTTTIYRLSIGLSIILTLAAFINLISWIVSLVMGSGSGSPAFTIPWITLLLVGLTAVNCTLRARLVGRKRKRAASANSETTS